MTHYTWKTGINTKYNFIFTVQSMSLCSFVLTLTPPSYSVKTDTLVYLIKMMQVFVETVLKGKGCGSDRSDIESRHTAGMLFEGEF